MIKPKKDALSEDMSALYRFRNDVSSSGDGDTAAISPKSTSLVPHQMIVEDAQWHLGGETPLDCMFYLLSETQLVASGAQERKEHYLSRVEGDEYEKAIKADSKKRLLLTTGWTFSVAAILFSSLLSVALIGASGGEIFSATIEGFSQQPILAVLSIISFATVAFFSLKARKKMKMESNQLSIILSPRDFNIGGIVSRYGSDAQKIDFLEALWDWKTTGSQEARKACTRIVENIIALLQGRIEAEEMIGGVAEKMNKEMHDADKSIEKNVVDAKWGAYNEHN